MDNKNEEIRLSKSFDELLDLQYGMIEAKKRNKFEEKVLYFAENEVLKKHSIQAKSLWIFFLHKMPLIIYFCA